MTETPMTPIDQLQKLYQRALASSGLPYRSPSHRIAEQLAATAQAHAYAKALWLVTGDEQWRSAAERLQRNVTDRVHIDQTDIDSNERQANTANRYGLRHLR